MRRVDHLVPNATFTNFDENLPLRGEPIRVDDVPGADAIQAALDRYQWLSNTGDPGAFAAYLGRAPLASVPAKALIIQFSLGDRSDPNPQTSLFLRSSELAGRATYFRTDLAYAAVPGLQAALPNPHTLIGAVFNPATRPFAFDEEEQIASFFASDGQTTIDPDGVGAIFETPIAAPLPDVLNLLW